MRGPSVSSSFSQEIRSSLYCLPAVIRRENSCSKHFCKLDLLPEVTSSMLHAFGHPVTLFLPFLAPAVSNEKGNCVTVKPVGGKG